MNPHSILSKDNEKIDMKSKSERNKTCGYQELAVTENSRKEDNELTWCNVDGTMCGAMCNVDNITQETLDKITSKMCKAQSELRELNHNHDAIKMERRILRCVTERTTN